MRSWESSLFAAVVASLRVAHLNGCHHDSDLEEILQSASQSSRSRPHSSAEDDDHRRDARGGQILVRTALQLHRFLATLQIRLQSMLEWEPEWLYEQRAKARDRQ
eukprot:COSAG02_NODE_10265_length_1982_cov_17.656896_1_plen_105_part_00